MSSAAASVLRIGMFGGSFDPPHRAHVALAAAAVRQLQLDALYIVPTGVAWHKARALSAAADRLAMTRLAFAGMQRVVVDERELQRDGPSFTIDTLEALQAENPGAQLYLIIGKDQLAALQTWHRWQDIVRVAIICIANRGDSARAEAGFDCQIELLNPLVPLQLPLMPVSATDIRRQIASGSLTSQSLARLVPEAVARYIESHRLYLLA
ncbi:nicotinate (nicotinamide) nucleotide adenylyltransferase [Polaromonas sp.]|uniref:nicotinate (nicotinamide) nucleotide adenylyltransferase n=1 Tax=Polaromonas sp. TaxID=1869339 RepID=UPI00272F860D|nr:nicotinate (nicotinamide) nucleotide adenylyltransferase [Polaromonas sp.]MDP1741997.1 nicotinate (nicotinamide) nucleotide adenylyltransferase [Polaromonas sp.]